MKKSLLVLTCLATFLLPPSTDAEELKIIIEANPSDFPQVKVIANIRDGKGAAVRGISQDQLEFQEDGYKCEITDFKERGMDVVEPIDITFVFDTTGSMSEEIAAVRDNIIDFAKVLKTTNMDYRLGLVTYGDKVRKVMEPDANVQAFKDTIAMQKADGGGDEPENALDALDQALKFDYRDNAKVVAILITDASYHSKNRYTKLTTLPLLKKYKEKGIALYTLAPRRDKYLWMAAETGGTYHDVTSNFTELVHKLAASLTAQYVVQVKATNTNADSSKRTLKLLLRHPNHSGQASAHYKAPASVSASSRLVEKNRPYDAYHPNNIVDGKKMTAWVEGVPGDGIGQWIKLTFTRAKKLKKIGIIAGYPKTPKLFKANNRVKTGTLVFSNGDTQVINFKNQPKMQYFTIKSKEPASWVKLVINSVYKGRRYRDTCIAEIEIKE